ncbi:MAG: phosphate acyltransferase [Bacteroidota bacterium]
MKIGLDIFGGDYAPDAILGGAIQAYHEMESGVKIVLIGNETDVFAYCKKNGFDAGNFEIVHTESAIGMGEHPAKSFAQKRDSSIVKGFYLLQQEMIDVFASAGNTGAMLVGAMQVVKSIPGVIRPSIAAAIPRLSDSPTILVDVGINVDCKPDVLYQYAILGSLYAEHVYNIHNPRVGLLNIGSEEEKGNLLSKTTFQAMKGTNEFNFIGNVEGNDFFSEKVDVIVCDGFVGNVLLKQAEAVYRLIRQRNIVDDFFEKFNFENIGGTPVLGINAPVIIGHGISNEKAIKNMILHAREMVIANLPDKIKQAFK